MKKKKRKERWVEIGVAAVDSGQLLVCDPCYIGSEWSGNEVEFESALKEVKTGKIFHGPGYKRPDFTNYEEEYKEGMTFNQAIAKGLLADMPEKETGDFSYDGCCKATHDIATGGQLNFKLGHAGAGVAFSTGLGDGVYPVFAKIVTCDDWGERIVEVRVDMMDIYSLENGELVANKEC